MRTKALILSAMICAAGVVPSFAADGNVYSVNVVGYITLSLSNNYTMIANQLDDGAGNLATNVFSGAPPGTIFSKFTGAGYANLTKTGPTSWSGVTSMTCAPGEGVFVKKPVNPAVVSLTCIGEVMQGTLDNPVVQGYEIYSTMVPQQGGISSVHEYVRTTGDILSRYTGAGYQNFTAIPSGTTNRWNPSEPIIGVGEAFWLRASVAKPWTRTFNVQ